jgi:hypothetical protein
MNRNAKVFRFLIVLMLSISGCQVSANTTSFRVSNEIVELISIAVSQLPYKTDYSNKEAINTTGGKIELRFSDGKVSIVEMSDDMVDFNLLNMTTLGLQNVNIVFTFNNQTFQTSFPITIRDINVALNRIDFVSSLTEVNLYNGNIFRLEVLFLPENASNQALEYRSTNEEIISVDKKGLVRALKAGKAEVIVESLANGQVITKSFSVTELLNPLSVTNARKLLTDFDSFIARIDEQLYTQEDYQIIIGLYNEGMFNIYMSLTEEEANLTYQELVEEINNVKTIPQEPEQTPRVLSLFVFVSNISELLEAANSVSNGQIIVLTDNIADDTTDLVISEIIELDLGGYTLTLNSLTLESTSSGNVYLSGGLLNLTNYIINIPNAELVQNSNLTIVSSNTQITTSGNSYLLDGILTTETLTILGNTVFVPQANSQLITTSSVIIEPDSNATIVPKNGSTVYVPPSDLSKLQPEPQAIIIDTFVPIGSSIQTAINNSVIGDTILLDAGIYFEEISFNNITNRTLIGSRRGNVLTVIAPTREYALNNNGISIFPGSHNITIKNLIIDGYANEMLGEVATFRDGIWYAGPGVANDNTFENLIIRNIDRRGISVFPMTTTGTTIKNNLIFNITGAVMGTWNGAVGINFQGTGIVEDNVIDNVVTGIIHNSDIASSGAKAEFIGNIIRNFRDPSTFTDTWHFNQGINVWTRKSETTIIEGNSIQSDFSRTVGMYLNALSTTSIIEANTLLLTGINVVGLDVLNVKNGGYQIIDNTIHVGGNSTAIAMTTLGSSSALMIVQGNNLKNTSPVATANAYEFNDFFNQITSREVGILISGSLDTKRVKDSPGPTHSELINNTIEGFFEGIVFFKNDLGTNVNADNNFIDVSNNIVTILNS